MLPLLNDGLQLSCALGEGDFVIGLVFEERIVLDIAHATCCDNFIIIQKDKDRHN